MFYTFDAIMFLLYFMRNEENRYGQSIIIIAADGFLRSSNMLVVIKIGLMCLCQYLSSVVQWLITIDEFE